MRWLPFADRSFDAITQWFTAFGYFEDREEDRKVLLEVQRILRPGGRHLLDTLDPDFVRATLVPQSEREVPGGRLLEERRLEDDRVVKSIRFVPSHSQEPSESWHESVRLWEAEELAELYRSVGMRVLHAFGHVDGSPRSAETRRLVFVAERLPEGEA